MAAHDLLAAPERPHRRRRHRGARAVPARARRAALAARRARRGRLDRHRARRRTDRARLPAEDALPQARRAGRRVRRPRGAQCRRAERRPDVLAAAGLPRARARSRGRRSTAGGFVRRMPWPGPDAADLVDPRRRARALPASCCTPPAQRRPGSGRSRPPGSRRAAPGWGSRPTTARSRTRSGSSAAPSTSTRAATAGRRPWPGCTTWASRRGGWCWCTCPARTTSCPRPARRSRPAGARSASSAPRCTTTSSGPIALAVIKRSLPDDSRPDGRRECRRDRSLVSGGACRPGRRPDHPAPRVGRRARRRARRGRRRRGAVRARPARPARPRPVPVDDAGDQRRRLPADRGAAGHAGHARAPAAAGPSAAGHRRAGRLHDVLDVLRRPRPAARPALLGARGRLPARDRRRLRRPGSSAGVALVRR